MPRSINIFTKGSILPPILEMETELIEQENEALKLAEEKIQEAKHTGEKLIEDTLKELPVIEEEERKKLLETQDAKVEELRITETRKLRELEQNIERNRKSVLDLLMKKITPHWDSRFLDV